jgi:hypothetical protein
MYYFIFPFLLFAKLFSCFESTHKGIQGNKMKQMHDEKQKRA